MLYTHRHTNSQNIHRLMRKRNRDVFAHTCIVICKKMAMLKAQVCLGQSLSGYNELNWEFICRPSQFSVCSHVDCNWPRPLTCRGQGSGLDLRGHRCSRWRCCLRKISLTVESNGSNIDHWKIMNRQHLSQSLTVLQHILVIPTAFRSVFACYFGICGAQLCRKQRN